MVIEKENEKVKIEKNKEVKKRIQIQRWNKRTGSRPNTSFVKRNFGEDNE